MIVKVRRPGIRDAINRDMRLLVGVRRLKSHMSGVVRQLPTLAARWLRRAEREDGGLRLSLRVGPLEGTTGCIVRGIVAAERGAKRA